MAEMEPEVAKRLFEDGATLVALDVPEGTEFGIDYNSWNTGPLFKGVKMIPPGIHFIFYSAANTEGQTAPRTGMFLFVKRKDVLVVRWDPETEDLVTVDVSEEERNRYRTGLKDMDRFLGAYPHENFKKWVSLTSYITKDLLERIQPVCKKISSVTEVAQEDFHTGKRAMQAEGTDSLIQRNQETVIRFTEIPKQKYPDGANPREISKHCMDSSYAFICMLKYMKDSKEILGELQFAFVCFLVGQVYDAFEHWKTLLNLLCTCDEALATHSNIFDALIGVLHFEIVEIPKDFFVDIVSANNFLTTTLQVFFSNLDSSTSVERKLAEKAVRFRQHLTKRFNWDFESEPDEFAPVVVDA